MNKTKLRNNQEIVLPTGRNNVLEIWRTTSYVYRRASDEKLAIRAMGPLGQAEFTVTEVLNHNTGYFVDMYENPHLQEGPEPSDEVEKDSPKSRGEHYHTGGIDVWTYLQANRTKEEVTGFHLGNALKYITRFGHKKGTNVEDLKKAKDSLDELIKIYEGDNGNEKK